MKRLMLMALVGLMVAGTIVAKAEDTTLGKLDAVEMDHVEDSIQHDIADGKMEAVIIQTLMSQISKEVEELSAMQDELSDIAITGGLIKAFGVVIDTAESEKERLNNSFETRAKDFEQLLQAIRNDKVILGKQKDKLLKSIGR